MAFKYTNVNPLDLTEEDCVTRAIALGSGLSYAEVQDKLYYISKLLDCEKLCVCCYHHLLDNVLGYDRLPCKNLTVGEVAEMYDDCILLIRIQGHLTCSVFGVIHDLWDCSNSYADIVWLVEESNM